MRDKFYLAYGLAFAAVVCLALSPVCWSVTSKVVRHSSNADFLKGEDKDVVVGSRGTVQLGRSAEMLVEEFADVWSLNSIVVSGGAVFVGTSPNGGIYKYSLGELTKIYPLETDKNANPAQNSKAHSDTNEPGGEKEKLAKEEPNAVEAEQYLANEHIFAMATDVAGRLLAGISGDKCRLIRFEAGRWKTIYEPNDAGDSPTCGRTKYIFAITTDDAGNIYLGTGPEGKIYRLDSFGQLPEIFYDSSDKNILSVTVGEDGFVYAGSDSRGLVYKINPRTKTATVLYDSDEPEITALLFSKDGDLYTAATSAKVVRSQTEYAARHPFAGRPESQSKQTANTKESKGGLKLQIANTKKDADDKPAVERKAALKLAKPGKASYVYKINKDGFVTDIFSETAVFFCLAQQDEKLLVATGNDARLFTVEPTLEEEAIIYEDEQSSQITAVAVAGQDVYLGTANPAKLIKLAKTFATEGTYTSELIDAGQPAKWGKLQIEADIPQRCKVRAACRSGNVKDVNDPTFSDWTELVEVTEPIQLRCPLGRFCQYKLVLESKDGRQSPLVREVAVAHSIPNLAPKVKSVVVSRLGSTGKMGFFAISYKAQDDNGDKLIYKIDFRKVGRKNWIELKDELEADKFEWDGKTVEDGRYEARVTASDERSNTTTGSLTDSRISEPVVVDNTGPAIKKCSVNIKDSTVTLKLEVSDELSAIGNVDYTVDSNAEWKAAMPDDLVYDTTEESFAIVIEKLEPGEHIIAVKVSDDVGNTTYKTFEVNINTN